jgi:2,4-dienoyl-CoA reductase-like NADH-dependent reductase (Old Yellow Enzyme family)
MMQKLVDEGTMEIISMSRPFLRQPNLLQRLTHEGADGEPVSCGLCMVGERLISCQYPDKQ